MTLQSNRTEASLFVIALFLVVQLVSVLTPPFQSPDEPTHVMRAYLLGRGAIFLGEGKGETGGMVDEGLLDYMKCFLPFIGDYTKKSSRDIPSSCQNIHFTRTEKFVGLANTAVYFPLAYFPQAVALFAGEHLDWRVSRAYYFARILSSVATLAILWWALLLYRAPPACIALFVMPMCIFQLASASLDPVTFALAALVGALFLRGMNRDQTFESVEQAALAFSVLLLAISRIVYVVLIVLLFAISWRRRSLKLLASSLTVALLSTSWIMFVLQNVHELGAHLFFGPSNISSIEIAKFYLYNPLSLVAVFARTFSDGYLLGWHWRSFVGILAWLDTPVDSFVYMAYGVLLPLLVTVPVARRRFQNVDAGNILLAVGAAISLFLIFFLALVGWDLYPAAVIEGVQGRYFYPPLILLAYAITPRLQSLERKLSLFAITLVATASLIDVVIKLKLRFG